VNIRKIISDYGGENMKKNIKMICKRLEKDLTQQQLREKSKTSLNTIVLLEKGIIDNIRVGTLKKIANALDSSVRELFFSDDEE
jgi:putative transcriptional regulator